MTSGSTRTAMADHPTATWQTASPMAIDHRPAWVTDAVFYQIFPDRFARSERLPKPSNLEPWDVAPSVHGYKGGDLYGVIERLDWLADLGVTALYFNPIFIFYELGQNNSCAPTICAASLASNKVKIFM